MDPIAPRQTSCALQRGSNGLEVRRELDGSRQVPFITTDMHTPLEQVAGVMFSRWSQENFFTYDATRATLMPCRCITSPNRIPRPALSIRGAGTSANRSAGSAFRQ